MKAHKKRNNSQISNPKQLTSPEEKVSLTFKDLLNQETFEKLQTTSNELKEREQQAQEAMRKTEQERRAREQQELENSFEYLLNQSDPNWKK